ncbi:hypothetical protein ACN42_g11087 [Penicillium freii]|uniref:Uncharacterized protein n=1 Tax=Penicillium freii TaxID=48697 RepID=A0A101M917_PENFR|nr:hypothetical protein ACN42_g11087 [Penicillium freii]
MDSGEERRREREAPSTGYLEVLGAESRDRHQLLLYLQITTPFFFFFFFFFCLFPIFPTLYKTSFLPINLYIDQLRPSI